MKTENTDHVDYSSIFTSAGLDSLSWNVHHDSSNHNPHNAHNTHNTYPINTTSLTGSSSVSPAVTPPASAVPSPSSTVTSPVALQDVNLHIPTTIPSTPMIPPTATSTPLTMMPMGLNPSSPISSRTTKPYSSPSKSGCRAPIVKPSAAEEELVRRIHRKVGGPAKLSTYDDPAKVRRVVIEALANEQTSSSEALRVRKGQLSVFERRVVRTVTNRGAAVRSRMRQRKEMAHLRHELRLRDVRVHQLESVVRALCSAYSVPLPPSVGVSERPGPSGACVADTVTGPAASVAAAAEAAAVEAAAASAAVSADMSRGPEVVPASNKQEPVALNSGMEGGYIGNHQQMFNGLMENVVGHMCWS